MSFGIDSSPPKRFLDIEPASQSAPGPKATPARRHSTVSAAFTLAQCARLVVVIAGIYACFFASGVYHEKIAAHKYTVGGEQRHFTFFIVTSLIVALSSCVVALAVSGAIHVAGFGMKYTALPPTSYLVGLGLTASFAGPISLAAAKHLSYPVFLTVKMCKMIPSVIVGRLWYGAQYSLLKYVAVVAITGGVVAFSMLSSRGDTEAAVTTVDDGWNGAIFSAHPRTVAMVLACFAGMTLSGYTVSTQDAILASRPDMPSLQLMFLAAAAQVAWCIGALIAGEFVPAWAELPMLKSEALAALDFFQQAPEALVDAVALGLLNAAGQVFLFDGVRLVGGITVVAIMTTRKVGSVCLSIAVHGHTIAFEQWLALGAVFVGVVVDGIDVAYQKRSKRGKVKLQ